MIIVFYMFLVFSLRLWQIGVIIKKMRMLIYIIRIFVSFYKRRPVTVAFFYTVVRPCACWRSFGRSAAVEGFSSQRLSAAAPLFLMCSNRCIP